MEPLREVDVQNRNGARARRQAEAEPRTIEAPDGSVHTLTATSLVVPEEKRCTATTLRGTRCKVGRMRGIAYCIFHSHLALDDQELGAIATGEEPRLSPRNALKAVVALRADELAQAAVRGALDSDGLAATRGVLALVDAVDPLVNEDRSLTLTAEGVEAASYRQLRAVFGTPS